jgi:hypothetical protein
VAHRLAVDERLAARHQHGVLEALLEGEHRAGPRLEGDLGADERAVRRSR